MKTVKITLAVIVVAAIIAAVIRGCMSLDDSGKVQLPQNTRTIAIEQKIDLLKKMPNSSFCDSLHKVIKYYIDDDYSQKKLGNTQSENDQWQKNLSSNLYAAYTDKFIQQAFYVFKGSEWEVQKINFIRTEYQSLQREGNQTGMLEKNSLTDQKLNEIKNIFLKYDEITGFINLCKALKFSKYDDINSQFPISTVEKYVIRSKEYLKNNLENNYVKHCERLKINLSAVPQIIFNAHVKYLDNRITFFNGYYQNYSSQKEYFDNLYTPLKNEIGKLYIGIYNENSLDTEYKKLDIKLKNEGTAAYNYFK